AYYLPQFHPIAENDEWWGKGFTEWTNVGKTKPLFRGHYQPRVPTELGYYDLRLPEVRKAQAQLAKEAGIEGFMYWHYWFGNGKRILEMPYNEVVKSGEPDFPFCLGWANHSWKSDSWQAKSTVSTPKMLIEQLYPGVADYEAHFYALLPGFQDKRYIKVNNRPVFLVYSPLDIPDCKLFLKTWNDLAQKNGLEGFHFVGMSKGWSSEVEKILALGFDAVNRNGQWEAECAVKGKYSRIIKNKLREKIGSALLDKYDYSKVVSLMLNDADRNQNVYPTILSNWDRSARSGRQAVIYTDSDPDRFEKHLKNALELVKDKDSENKIVFLKSWNEWGEGNYVEPDLKFGKAYL
ncbi:MAG: lipopolysaccharide biosynthesis protein, partial [Chryseobacterium sp.]